MSGHTRGPWEAKGDWIKSPDGTVVALAYDGAGPDGKDDPATEAANARLIAAAPDLLSALQEIVHDVNRGNGGNDCIEQAERIIAKATGAA